MEDSFEVDSCSGDLEYGSGSRSNTPSNFLSGRCTLRRPVLVKSTFHKLMFSMHANTRIEDMVTVFLSLVR